MATQTEQPTLGELYNPPHAPGWKPTSLYTVADWINGVAFKDVHFSEAGKPVIKIAEIKNGITSQTQFTDGEYDSDVHIKAGDTLFAWSGQPETSIGVSIWQGQDGWLNQHIFKVLPHDGIDKDFLYFFLMSLNSYFVRIAKNKQTTGLGHITKEDLRAMQVGIPSFNVQREVAQVILPLERKIELLRRQNETLEQTAQVIFNEWFVKPTAAGELPGGWNSGVLKDIAVVDWGNTNLTKAAYVSTGEYLGVSAAGCDGRMSHAEHEVGTTVLSAIGEYAGRTFYPTEPFTAIKNTITVSPKSGVSTGWFIHHLLTANAIPRRGAAQPFLSKGDTEAYSVAVPPVAEIEHADALFSGFEEKQKSNTASIKTLASVRDALLPRLMSGEIRV